MSSTGLLFALLASIGWGMVYVLYERALQHTTPLLLMLIYGYLSITILTPLLYFRGDLTAANIPPLETFGVLAAAVVCSLVSSFFIVSSITHLGAEKSAVLEISYPLFTALFAWLLFGRSLSLWFVAGFLMIAGGSLVIILKGSR